MNIINMDSHLTAKRQESHHEELKQVFFINSANIKYVFETSNQQEIKCGMHTHTTC